MKTSLSRSLPGSVLLAASAFVVLLAAGLPANAQRPADWPGKPVHVVVPYPPGGPNDVIARLVSQKLSERSGPALHHRQQARRRPD